jgi:hypothetical protein
MRIVFWMLGGFGFLICGFGTFFAINPSTPALMAVSTVLLIWIGGTVLFGLSAIRQRQEWLPIQIGPPTVDETRPKHRGEIAARLGMS